VGLQLFTPACGMAFAGRAWLLRPPHEGRSYATAFRRHRGAHPRGQHGMCEHAPRQQRALSGGTLGAAGGVAVGAMLGGSPAVGAALGGGRRRDGGTHQITGNQHSNCQDLWQVVAAAL
jgi:hypothetical protein